VALRAALLIDGEDTEQIARLTAAALHGIVETDVVQLLMSKRNGYPVPPLYRSGVVYLSDLLPREAWWTIWEVLDAGGGICEDLACWRIAELKGEGIDARPVVYHPDGVDGPVMMHALVGVPVNQARRWRELTTEQIRGVELPGPAPELRRIPGAFAIEDPSRVLGMRGSAS
jgi:hypothetical protein